MSKTTWISALNPKIPYARFLKGSKSNRRKKHVSRFQKKQQG